MEEGFLQQVRAISREHVLPATLIENTKNAILNAAKKGGTFVSLPYHHNLCVELRKRGFDISFEDESTSCMTVRW